MYTNYNTINSNNMYNKRWTLLSLRAVRSFTIVTLNQGCQIFLHTICIPKWGDISNCHYQTAIKYTNWLDICNTYVYSKWPQNTYINFFIQGPPKLTQIGIYVPKINHLATLGPDYHQSEPLEVECHIGVYGHRQRPPLEQARPRINSRVPWGWFSTKEMSERKKSHFRRKRNVKK
jgi:hypothetical protein